VLIIINSPTVPRSHQKKISQFGYVKCEKIHTSGNLGQRQSSPQKIYFI
jgi:hypothetical protein